MREAVAEHTKGYFMEGEERREMKLKIKWRQWSGEAQVAWREEMWPQRNSDIPVLIFLFCIFFKYSIS